MTFMIDDEFSESLTGELKKDYLNKKRNIIRESEAERETKFKFYHDSQIQEIGKDGRHRNILNLCVAPFTENGSMFHTGYRYIRPAPLIEIGEKNFDFLLFKRNLDKPIAIFGECKGTISNPSDIITEIESRKNAIERNIDLIKVNYLKIPKETEIEIECVLSVPSQYSQELVNYVVKTKKNLIVWHAPLTGEDEISMARPPNDGITEIRYMLHHERELNEMSHTVSNRRIFSYFPQGHPALQLNSLISALHYESSTVNVSRDYLKEVISQALFYTEQSVEQTTAKILEDGLKIDFLDKSNDGILYKIKSNTRKPEKLANILEEKWINNRFEEHNAAEIEARVIALREEIERALGRQHRL